MEYYHWDDYLLLILGEKTIIINAALGAILLRKIITYFTAETFTTNIQANKSYFFILLE